MNSNELITEYGLDALSAVLHETAVEIAKLAIGAIAKEVLHSLDEVLKNKIEKNTKRPPLHGNLF